MSGNHFVSFGERELLLRYAKDHGYTNTKVLIDDGYTGTNFNRPGVQEGFELVKQGLVGCWLVKDMSRFGRDYLTVGQYTDIIFPSYDVRFIAVADGVDSAHGDKCTHRTNPAVSASRRSKSTGTSLTSLILRFSLSPSSMSVSQNSHRKCRKTA